MKARRKKRQSPAPTIRITTASRDGHGVRTLHEFYRATCTVLADWTIVDHAAGRTVFRSICVDEIREQP